MVIDDLLKCMNIIGDDTIQRTQLIHRLSLVKAFQIQPGMRVLEIGCGQGDTTVALADAVGENGHVTAIDIASPNYGAPITLGQATHTIAQSVLGKRISFHLNTDLMDFEENEYDVAVLSHCSWYFNDPEQLLVYFKKLRKMAKRICIAEWDLSNISPSQMAHFSAVTILALHSEFVENDGNIQHLFDRYQLQSFLEKAGWHDVQTASIDATYLQDGEWEVDYAQYVQPSFQQTSSRIQALVNSLSANLKTDKVASLNSCVLSAI